MQRLVQASRWRDSLALARPLPLIGSLTNVPISTSIAPITPVGQGARQHRFIGHTLSNVDWRDDRMTLRAEKAAAHETLRLTLDELAGPCC